MPLEESVRNHLIEDLKIYLMYIENKFDSLIQKKNSLKYHS